MLRTQALSVEDEKNLDIDYSDKVRGRMARMQLEEMGESISEKRINRQNETDDN